MSRQNCCHSTTLVILISATFIVGSSFFPPHDVLAQSVSPTVPAPASGTPKALPADHLYDVLNKATTARTASDASAFSGTVKIGGATAVASSALQIGHAAGGAGDDSLMRSQVSKHGLIISSPSFPNNGYFPGLVWETGDDNPGKPKMGIWGQKTSTGSKLFIGTSNNYAAGITNQGLTVDQSGSLGIGATSPEAMLHILRSSAGWAMIKLQNTAANTGGGGSQVSLDAAANQYALIDFTRAGANRWYLGMVTNDKFVLRDTNAGADRITVDANGNVGIGTTQPGQKLSVTDTLAITNAAGIQYLLMGNQDSSGVNNPAIISAANGGLYFGGGTNWSGSGGTFSASMSILDNGNVGIGTTSPGGALEVKRTSGDAEIFANYNNTYMGRLTAASNGNVYIGVSKGSGSLSLGVNDDVTALNISGVAIQDVTQVGNVGIGARVPQSPLHVLSSSSDMMRLENSGGRETDIRFLNGNGDWQVGTNQGGNGTERNQFYIYDELGNDKANRYAFTVQRGTGNVGIGTVAPQNKLHVIAPGGFPNNVPIVAQSNSTFFGARDTSGNERFAINLDGDGTSYPVNFYDKYDGNWHQSISLKKGNVGIGTTSPGHRLEIASATGLIGITPDTGAGWGGSINLKRLSDNLFWHISGPRGDGDDGDLTFYYNNGDYHPVMTLQNNGNVGIGTPSPGTKLHIEQKVNGRLEAMVQNKNSGGSAALGLYASEHFQDRGGRLEFVSNSNDLSLVNDGDPGGTISFWTRYQSPDKKMDVTKERLRITNDGLSTPNLELKGWDAVLHSRDNADRTFDLIGSYQGWWNGEAVTIAGYNAFNNPSQDAKYVSIGGPSGGESRSGWPNTRFWVDLMSGNVGINTSNPQAKLDVQGSFRNGAIITHPVGTLGRSVSIDGINSYEIARIGHDNANWSENTSVFIDLYQKYYNGGGHKRYEVRYGNGDRKGSIRLIEATGEEGFSKLVRARISEPVIIEPVKQSNNQYYLRVFVDTDYYTLWDTVVSHNMQESQSTEPRIGEIKIFENPSGASMSGKLAEINADIVTNEFDQYFSGNVGIGTSVAKSRLHIENTASTLMKWQRTGTSDLFGIEANSSGFGFYNYTSTNWNMWFNKDGNVGIGATDPKGTLQVGDDSNAILLIGSNNSGKGGALSMTNGMIRGYWGGQDHPRFEIDRDEGGSANSGIGFGDGNSPIDTRLYRLKTHTLATDDYFIVKGGGRIGIGATEPQANFDLYAPPTKLIWEQTDGRMSGYWKSSTIRNGKEVYHIQFKGSFFRQLSVGSKFKIGSADEIYTVVDISYDNPVGGVYIDKPYPFPKEGLAAPIILRVVQDERIFNVSSESAPEIFTINTISGIRIGRSLDIQGKLDIRSASGTGVQIGGIKGFENSITGYYNGNQEHLWLNPNKKTVISSNDSSYGQFQIGNYNSGGEASMAFISGANRYGVPAGSINGNDYIWVMGANIWGIGGNKFGIGNVKTGGSLLTLQQQDGRVGIGTNTPKTKLDVQGGDINVGYHSEQHKLAYQPDRIGLDVAELFESEESVEVGDIVVVSEQDRKLKKSSHQYEDTIVGVVSGSPALLFEGSELKLGVKPNRFDKGTKPPVALAGRIPVKVSLENGVIKPGDYLTSSSKPGVAMKASELGMTVGVALESYDGSGEGTILVFLNLVEKNANARIKELEEKEQKQTTIIDMLEKRLHALERRLRW